LSALTALKKSKESGFFIGKFTLIAKWFSWNWVFVHKFVDIDIVMKEVRNAVD